MMSTLPSTAEVAGVHVSMYESYYNLVDPNHHGQVGAMDAAKFLKKSHLSDVILSKIWDLADPDSRGYLDKRGMFVALKLCALAQQGHNLNTSNLHMDIDPPKMGDILNTSKSAPCTHSSFTSSAKGNWSISPLEKAKYDQLFRSLEPINGYIPGNKVKGVLMDSKLPLKTLGQIWDLADIDKDGKLNQQEFTIAMHLVYKALEKYTVPSELPAELVNIKSSQADTISKIDVSSTSVSGAILPTDLNVTVKEIKSREWVVSDEDKVNSDKLFVQADEDLDGFVSGNEIKDIFFQSGLTQTVLAEIWSLCDISQNGKLNNEQFALAMWLIKKKLHGVDLPKKLTTEMIPPSFRQKSAQTILENNNLCAFSNPELDMISKDIKELIQEKHGLEQDISQKEADIKIKNGEIKSLQSELDTLAATLKQLDNQKGEAQKRLNDLQTQVEKLRQQASDQESNLHFHESELNNKRKEIECLKLVEQNLETKQHSCNGNLNSLSQFLQSIQLQISQTKANMTQLEEQQRQIVDVLTQYDAALTIGDASVITDSLLTFKAKLDRATYSLKSIDDTENLKKMDKVTNKDSYNNNNIVENDNNFTPFENIRHEDEIDRDPFENNFHGERNKETPSSLFDTSMTKSYDPFNDKLNDSKLFESKQDPFGDDPFAALHAPTRSDSPSPALPPKKTKLPPPRPAPPRPMQGPQLSSFIAPNTDPFAEKAVTSNTGRADTFEFADFANFDSK